MTRRAVPGTIILPLRECLRHPTQPGRALHGITVLCRRRDPVRTAAAMSRPAAIKAVTSPLARSRCCALIAAAPAWSRAQRRPEFHRHIAWHKPTGVLPNEIGQARHAAEASRPTDCAAAQAPADPIETVADHDPDQGQPAASVQDPRPRQHAARTTASPATTTIQIPDRRTVALRRSPPDGATPAMVGVNVTAEKLAPREPFCCLAIKMSVIGARSSSAKTIWLGHRQR